LYVHHGQPEDFDLRQGRFDGFQAGWLDDGDDQLHQMVLRRLKRSTLGPA
jgi:hypothetical protein